MVTAMRQIGVFKYTFVICFLMISCVEKSAVNHSDGIRAIEEMLSLLSQNTSTFYCARKTVHG